MGGGSWTSMAFADYTTSTKHMNLADYETHTGFTAQSLYKSRNLSPVLNPHGVMRECHDSEEHPESFPVILALDVTGSMGDASVRVAQKLNEIMTELYADENIKDIEFCVMGIGDLAYDSAPIQMSQFESDIRIAEQLDELYFEAGGGGNHYESYSAAWYMGVNHCDLHCWKRGKKGLIITMGDELPNPYLPRETTYRYATGGLTGVTGDNLQGDVETKELLEETLKKFDVYHIAVDDRATSYRRYQDFDIDKEWKDLLGDHYRVATLDSLANTIVNIVKDTVNSGAPQSSIKLNENAEVTW